MSVIVIAEIATLREQWDALELALLKPAVLTDTQWQAILNVRHLSGDAGFMEAMPFTIASFKPGAEQAVLEAIQNRDSVLCSRLSSSYYEMFSDDILKIHNVLFGSSHGFFNTGCEIGFFDSPKVGDLHVDYYDTLCAVYVVRLGALPFEAIKGRREAVATAEERLLIEQGGMSDEFGRHARQTLRSRGILEAHPLGEVALIAGGPVGTRHCSSETPEAGAYSGFCWALGGIRTQLAAA